MNYINVESLHLYTSLHVLVLEHNIERNRSDF